MTDITDINEFRKLQEEAIRTKDPTDLHNIVCRLVILLQDLTYHLSEAQNEIKSLKSRQLKLGQWVSELRGED